MFTERWDPDGAIIIEEDEILVPQKWQQQLLLPLLRKSPGKHWRRSSIVLNVTKDMLWKKRFKNHTGICKQVKAFKAKAVSAVMEMGYIS